MNTNDHQNDSLTESLIADTKALAVTAATTARARRRARQHTLSFGAPLIIFIILVACFIHYLPHQEITGANIAKNPQPSKPRKTKTHAPIAYVRAFPAGEPVESEPLVQQTNKEEEELLNDLPDVPVLIVRNSAGRVTSFHVFDKTD